MAFFGGNPLLLVFFVSVAGNIIPFFPTPSLLIIVALVTAQDSAFGGIGLIQIGAIAALGAAIGKFVSYALGYGVRRAFGKPERFESLKKLLGGSTFLVGLVFAASPLVDAAFIPLGIMRYSVPKSFLSLYTGKFAWILSVLFVARTSARIVTQTFGTEAYASIFSVGLVIAAAFFMIRVDWEKRLLGRKNSLRSRLIARVKRRFSKTKDTDGGVAPVTNS